MGKKIHSFWSILTIAVAALVLCSISCCVSASNVGGLTRGLRGGYGVKAPIDNYQLAWGNRPVTWNLAIEGSLVLFGSSSGTVAAMGKGVARSSLFPPAFGFGLVTVTLTIMAEGSTLETHMRSGFMFGPFVFLTG